MSDGGKGSARRPAGVTDKQLQTSWDTIFGGNAKKLGYRAFDIFIQSTKGLSEYRSAMGNENIRTLVL